MSCVDLIFSYQPNLVMSSGIHSSLHQNFHHQIVFAKFNLKVHYLPPYEHEVWHFKKTNTDHIKRAINGFPWERSFTKLHMNDIVYLFNQTIKKYALKFHTSWNYYIWGQRSALDKQPDQTFNQWQNWK